MAILGIGLYGPNDMSEPLRDRQRHPANAPGDFYVENERCITCAMPHEMAPDLMAWFDDGDGGSSCYFKRQPTSPAEIDQAIAALRTSCCGALRYGGKDPEIRRRLQDSFAGDPCDLPLNFLEWLLGIFKRRKGPPPGGAPGLAR